MAYRLTKIKKKKLISEVQASNGLNSPNTNPDPTGLGGGTPDPEEVQSLDGIDDAKVNFNINYPNLEIKTGYFI